LDKTRHFGKITAFNEKHGFRDYLLSLQMTIVFPTSP